MTPPAPHNLPAEEAVLGACLIDAAAFARVAPIIQPEDFFRDAHRHIFLHMRTLAARGIPIDLIPLKDELARSGTLDQVGGPAYITKLTDGVPHAANVEHYARLVVDKSTTRRLRHQLADVVHALEHDDRDRALARLRTIADDALTHTDDELLLEPAAAVAGRESATPPIELVRQLLFGGCVGLWFGPERSFKSLAKREIAAAVASGRAPFHLSRLVVPEAVPVAYVTEEDNAGAVLEHLDAFSDGQVTRGALPLYLSACKGLSLDDPRTQDRLIRDVSLSGARLVVLEPLRSLTSCVDQGPRELQPFTAFLRRLIRETGASVLLGHHAVKPVAGHDPRKGNQRVSGGGLLSISEAPVEFTRVDDWTVTMTPRGFKHTATPPPIQLHLEARDGRVHALTAVEFAPPHKEDDDSEITRRVLDVVRGRPDLSSSEVHAKIGGRKQTVVTALHALKRAGQVDSVKSGHATRWRVKGEGDE